MSPELTMKVMVHESETYTKVGTVALTLITTLTHNQTTGSQR